MDGRRLILPGQTALSRSPGGLLCQDRGIAYFYINDYRKSWADMQKAMGYGHNVDQNFIRRLKNNKVVPGPFHQHIVRYRKR